MAAAAVSFDALPEEALRVIFLALPVDARAQAACVCRSWRAFLEDASLWQVLDLTAGGVAAERVAENLMRGAVARAARQLRELSFDNRPDLNLMVNVIQSDGAELQQVKTDAWLTVTELQAVFAAAPRLQVLGARVDGYCMELLPVLRNDAPYGPLRISELSVNVDVDVNVDDIAEAALGLALAPAVAEHESLRGLMIRDPEVRNAHFAPGLNALVDAAAERRVARLNLDFCTLDAGSVPALVRLLQRGSLTELRVDCPHHFPDDTPEATVLELCTALRHCSMLTHLYLRLDQRNGVHRDAVNELLDAVAELPALADLDLSFSFFQDPVDAGRALGVLLRTDPPSLRCLDLSSCGLGDEALALLLDGLAVNTHLRWLNDFQDHDASHSDEFQRDRLEPALAAWRAARRA
jgi:hypothetical protein